MKVPGADVRAGDQLYLHVDGWFDVQSANTIGDLRHLRARRRENGRMASLTLSLHYPYIVQRPPGRKREDDTPEDDW